MGGVGSNPGAQAPHPLCGTRWSLSFSKCRYVRTGLPASPPTLLCLDGLLTALGRHSQAMGPARAVLQPWHDTGTHPRRSVPHIHTNVCPSGYPRGEPLLPRPAARARCL